MVNLHKSISDYNRNICSAISVRPHPQVPEVLFCQRMSRVSQVQFEHIGSAINLNMFFLLLYLVGYRALASGKSI